MLLEKAFWITRYVTRGRNFRYGPGGPVQSVDGICPYLGAPGFPWRALESPGISWGSPRSPGPLGSPRIPWGPLGTSVGFLGVPWVPLGSQWAPLGPQGIRPQQCRPQEI